MVRAAALAALAAAFAVPLARRRLGVPAAGTVAAAASGPLALASLRPRTKARDAALFGLQMWAFTVIHELPFDDPERLRRRLRVRYPIRADTLLGLGELPNVRLQRRFSRRGEVTTLDRVLAVVHWAWFCAPHLALVWILIRREERFARAARQMAAAFDLGCAIYHLIPTAPPWWAAEQSYLSEEAGRGGAKLVAEASPPRLRRMMVEVGERTWGRAWPRLYDSLGGNPWAAMPSLHFATSVLAAILLAESGPFPAVAGWGYAATLGFALVYLGEHYAIDLVAGAALVALVRGGEPLADPLARRVNALAQRLERLAN
ncbi:MAG TPA: phosphatase PAP2 family protein [Solirubrobacterales bacterium]|nr:phosphatase PAP2 family protein [Solirubrobacterales bacterium]